MKVKELIAIAKANTTCHGAFVIRNVLSETYVKGKSLGDHSINVVTNSPIVIGWSIKGWKTYRRWNLRFSSDRFQCDPNATVTLTYGKRELLSTDELDEVAAKIKEHNEKLIILEKKVINTKAISNYNAGQLILESMREKLPKGFAITGALNVYSFTFKADNYNHNVRAQVKSEGAILFIDMCTQLGDFKFKVEMADPSFVPEEFIERFFRLMIDSSRMLNDAYSATHDAWLKGYIKEGKEK